ncbi:MAG: GTP-binding protein [Candidatus Magnetoglobus multicellularis str. Araruama]|uniref:GTPase Der n=1 Tax=Candidatus Magnetoglobus multicellularis str. Araruama TaxID=890399 RepID=A0A1V1P9Q4_9BACT|nr:MAG: GTP-binding protein [Candidatus Magnetoglobus multicellularis str. Araruama]
MNPKIAIIGRSNVGKSTLFNRITRSRQSIVDNMPGVTRDRIFKDAEYDGKNFTVIDTGGIFDITQEGFIDEIHAQAIMAKDQADLIVVVFDGKSGLSPFDLDLVQLVRDIKCPVMFAVNKIDGSAHEDKCLEFYQAGMDRVYPISAEHGYGVRDFLDDLVQFLPQNHNSIQDDGIKLAVVGRPNAGKSSLVNAMLGQERVMVSDIPGTTRDAIDTYCQIDDNPYVLIDTAGIRRKGKVRQKIEKFSIIKALNSLDRCDIALIVLDAFDGITEQDIRIAGYAHERKCACIFVFNKWDLVEKQKNVLKKFTDELRYQSRFLQFAPVISISAKTGQRVKKLFPLIQSLYKQYACEIGTSQINRIIEQAIQKTPPPLYRGRPIKFMYTTQMRNAPPTFVSFVNYPKAVHFSYHRYLLNQIRFATGLDKTPIFLYFRQRVRRSKNK